MARHKIGLVGAGQIGGVLASLVASRGLGDCVLLDVVEGVPQGKALDIRQGTAVNGYVSAVVGSNDYADLKGCDVVIVTAGKPRKPGMSRDDLLKDNSAIMTAVSNGIKENCPDAFIIMVANPLDAMVYMCHKIVGCPPNQIMGMAGMLDTSRFSCFISMETGVAISDIKTMVLGGHGDTMVPLQSYCTIGGIPLDKWPGMTQEKIDAMIKRTAGGGGEIVKLLGTGSAFVAPAQSAIAMAEAVLHDQKRVMPCAAYCQGEYGYKDMFIGVPAILGKGGVEKIVEIPLTDDEKKKLDHSRDAVQELIDDLHRMKLV